MAMETKKSRKSNFITVSIIALVGIILIFSSFYTYWNSAPAEQTCASCHEISSRVTSLSHSAHREVSCKECHGTALSNGLHSLKEKSMMVIGHLKGKKPDEVRMNEEQYLAVMESCVRCHTSEYAKWKSGGHSANYSHIFLDEKHNSVEQLNYDCLRCHGMFYENSIDELVDNKSTKGPWNLMDKKKATQPTMPCSACHSIHADGEIVQTPDYANPSEIFYNRDGKIPEVSFYARSEKTHIPVDLLSKPNITHEGKNIMVSDEPMMRNCVQCHAPNTFHVSATSDDRTPRGVHEGLSCMACHEPHSNDAKNSCIKCHPSISNCNLDVTTMNTTYADAGSPNNIHWVSCTDCHTDGSKKSVFAQNCICTEQNNPDTQ